MPVLAKRGVIPGIRLDKGAEVFAQFVSKRSLKDLMTVRVRRLFRFTCVANTNNRLRRQIGLEGR
jgi:hypothetical protein